MTRGSFHIPHPLYTQHDLDSGSLTMKCVVAHPIRRRGAYLGTIFLEHRTVAAFLVDAGDASDRVQVTLDLVELQGLGRRSPPDGLVRRIRVREGGYLVFHVSAGDGGYHAILRGPGEDSGAWDSRRLQDGDVFSVIPLRPGTYRLTNTAQEQAGAASVTVSYPDPRHAVPDSSRARPLYLHCDQNGFSQPRIAVTPGQGVVISPRADARLLLTLMEPDDGPPDLTAWREQERARLLREVRSRR